MVITVLLFALLRKSRKNADFQRLPVFISSFFQNLKPSLKVHLYTSHFLQRYNERFLHNKALSPNEIAGFYFLRNPKPLLIKLNEDINRNFQKYGEFNNGVRVDDGFCFAQTGIFCEKIMM